MPSNPLIFSFIRMQKLQKSPLQNIRLYDTLKKTEEGCLNDSFVVGNLEKSSVFKEVQRCFRRENLTVLKSEKRV